MSEGNKKKGRYVGASAPEEVKKYRAQLFVQLREVGLKLEKLVELNDKTDYPASERTLRHHMASVKSGQPILKEEKKSGGQSVLTDQEWDIVAGVILCEKEKVDSVWVRTFVRDNFGHDYSESSISRHVAALNLSYQLTGRRKRKEKVDFSDYVVQYFDFVSLLHNVGFFKGDPRWTLCLDFCTDSRRLDREKTISQKGGKQKKLSGPKPKYTNSFLACVAWEHDHTFRPMMFTYDPAFDPKGKRWKEVVEWCKKWNIDPTQIYYEKSSKVYCAEDNTQTGHFFAKYRNLLKGCRILHDDGNSFKRGKNWIFEDGAGMHFVFPSDVHGELSVLDNKIFSIAKTWWRLNMTNQDFSYDSLYLLSCIQSVLESKITHFWETNFFLADTKLTLAAVEDLLSGKDRMSEKRKLEYTKYVKAYSSWIEVNGGIPSGTQKRLLETSLDGPFWN